LNHSASELAEIELSIRFKVTDLGDPFLELASKGSPLNYLFGQTPKSFVTKFRAVEGMEDESLEGSILDHMARRGAYLGDSN
jgi:hypothetical protein